MTTTDKSGSLMTSGIISTTGEFTLISNAERVELEDPEGGRNCTQCGEFKVWKQFPRFEKGYMHHRPNCKSCHQKQNNDRNAENRDEMRRRGRDYYNTPANKTRILANRQKRKKQRLQTQQVG